MSKAKKSNPRCGTRFDDWLKEEGIYEQVVAQAKKELSAGTSPRKGPKPDDVEASIAKRKAERPKFARRFEKGYQAFKKRAQSKK